MHASTAPRRAKGLEGLLPDISGRGPAREAASHPARYAMSGSDSASEFADTTSLYARAKWWFDKLTSAECIRLYVCPVLVVQNSAMFLVMKHSTALHDDHYHTTVAVLMQEIFKLIISITLIVTSAGGFVEPLEKLWGLRRQALVLAIPAVCYTGQNNLLYVGVTYLPAAVAQVLVQTKLLWAAVFSITLLGKRFSREAWTSFVVLIVGVVLVKNGDSRKHGPAGESSSLGAGALIGMAASIGSAGLSGFAGVYLERTFNKGVATLLQMNVWLAVVSIPLQTLAIIEFDREGIARGTATAQPHIYTATPDAERTTCPLPRAALLAVLANPDCLSE